MTTATASTTTAAPDLAAVKTKQQAMWASGDFAVIGTTLQIVGEMICEAVDVCAGERVLDVAAGNGNATLAAARRFAAVTSTDYVPTLLDGGRRRAEAEGLVVRFEPADAENLPYGDASFDVVLSTFGVMFAPDHERAAHELLRQNSAAAAAAIRALSDEELANAATNSLYADAPLTCQHMLEDHAVRHCYHHLAKIQAAVQA